MIQSVCILGRQPALGLAELESIYGAAAVVPIAHYAAGLTLDPADVDFARLGGSTRHAVVVGEVPGQNWNIVQKKLIAFVKSSAFQVPAEGKFHLGVSAYGFDVSPAKVGALGLTLKRIVRTRHNGSVQLAPNNDAELSTAQVTHHSLTSAHGAELLVIAGRGTTYIAKTLSVQDIAGYTRRDRERPRRDARVGMLPPKLAQIIVNLAAANTNPLYGAVVLDPFCGTGVVLQEATMMGFDAYGSDLDPRMVEYTDTNLLWLLDQPGCPVNDERKTAAASDDWRYFQLEQGDATRHTWKPMPPIVASETYLGRPFTEPPDAALLAQTISEVNLILQRFLQNSIPQLPSGARMCLAVPCWFEGNTQKHLPLLERIETMGVQKVAFQHAPAHSLIYHREGQIVGRELVVAEKL